MPIVAPLSQQFGDVDVSENKYSGINTDSQYKDLRKPRRVKFYVNGDRFFKGKKIFITPNRYFNFHDLLNDLTNKLPKNNVHLPYGVRQIFTAGLGELIKDIEQLQDGNSYVCAGFEGYKIIKYGNYEMEPWSFGRPHESLNLELNRNNGAISETVNSYNAFHPGRYFHVNNHYHHPQQQQQQHQQHHHQQHHHHQQQQQHHQQQHQQQQQQPSPQQQQHQQVRKPLVGLGASYNRVNHVPHTDNNSTQRRPKVVTVVRYGSYPRNTIKMFLNRQTIQSFEQIMGDISESFGAKWQNKKFHRLFSLRGKQVHGINDFFREDDVFLAVGNEQICDSDIQEIIQELYPNSPYAKSLLKQWQKTKRRRLVHDIKYKSEKLDSGFGSSESNKKVIMNDYISSSDSKTPGYSTELASSRLNTGKNFRMLLKADRFKDRVLYEEDVETRKRQKKMAESNKSSLVRNNNNNIGGGGGGGGCGDDGKGSRGGRRSRCDGDKDADNNNKNKTMRVKKGFHDKSANITNENKENLIKPMVNNDALIETMSKLMAKISSVDLTSISITDPASNNNIPPYIINNNSNITNTNIKTKMTPPTTTSFTAVTTAVADINTTTTTTTTSTTSNTPAVPTTTVSISHTTPNMMTSSNEQKTDQLSVFEPFPARKSKLGYQVLNSDILDRYYLGRTLGYGNFAEVREAKRKQGLPCEVAMKIIDKNKIIGKERMVENEICILTACRHNNIVKLYEEFETPDRIYLAMELVKGGDLFDAITQSVKFEEPQSAIMVQDLGSALFYLHSMGIVHRDLKPENLLVYWNKEGFLKLKLADFGLAMEITEDNYTVCGTPTYVAPEILTQEGYGLEVDMWATGVICFILLCGFPPFHSHDRRQSDLFEKIKAGEYEFLTPYWDQISKYAKGLIRHLLVVDRRRRYTAADVLCHPWILCGGNITWILHGQELANNQKKLREKLSSDGRKYLNNFKKQKI